MEISAAAKTLSLSLPSIPRTSPSPSLFSSNSAFFNNDLLKKKTQRTHCMVLTRSSSRARRGGLSCTCLFGLGVPELVVIAGVAAVVFGPKKLPEVGRSIGKTIKSFQQAAKEFESELKKEPETEIEASADKPMPVSEEKKQDRKPRSQAQKRVNEAVVV